MEEIILKAEDLGISQEKWEEAYNSLYEEFGFVVTLWSKRRLEKEIINFWEDRDD